MLGACPVPISDYKEIVLAHRSGGRLSQQLLQRIVFPQFENALLAPQHGGAIFPVGGTRIVDVLSGEQLPRIC